MSDHIRVPFTMFGKTKDVPLRVFKDGKPVDDGLPQWDADVWIERGEDWYALSSANLKGKRVLVVERDDFLRSPNTSRPQ